MPKKAIILGYLFFVILALILYFNWQLIIPYSSENQPLQKFTIEKGESLKSIARRLEEQGFIRSRQFFEIYAFLTNKKNDFWPGEYEISPSMRLSKIIEILTSKIKPQEKKITIIEGWNKYEIAHKLAQENLVQEEKFLNLIDHPPKELVDQYSFLKDKPETASLEGYLFPDTYRFFAKTTEMEVLKKFLDNFSEKLSPELIAEIKKQNKTIFEVINLASIVELEAHLEQDRRIIADIFWRRLEIGMPLQANPTINYVLKQKKAILTYKETKIDSPYNTYLNRGLPPTAISNPSLESIKAVIYPLKNDYWYFFATPDGRNIFSKTKSEHDRLKNKYLK